MWQREGRSVCGGNARDTSFEDGSNWQSPEPGPLHLAVRCLADGGHRTSNFLLRCAGAPETPRMGPAKTPKATAKSASRGVMTKEVPQRGNLAQNWIWGFCSGQGWRQGPIGVVVGLPMAS